MGKDRRLIEHARHNFDACKLLNTTTGYNDWVITMAYYSAMYYVYHFIFPESLLINGKRVFCQTFHFYYDRHSETTRKRSGKHSVSEDLVNEEIPSIYDDFSTLNENCRTARYFSYKMTDEQAQLAVECLDRIKAHCEPPTAVATPVVSTK